MRTQEGDNSIGGVGEVEEERNACCRPREKSIDSRD